MEISQVCEEEGYDSVWATDHVIMPADLKEPYGELLEPLTTLSFIASRTRRLRLGTSVLVLPQRNPILVAKQAATLDVFSGGRVTLGLGAGWAEKEFGFMNSDFSRRGRVFDEEIRLMKALWSMDQVNFQGEFFKVSDAVFLPKPLNRDISVWIGGNGPKSVRRAMALGDGWHPVGPTLDDFRWGAERIRAAGKGLTVSVRMTADVRKRREGVKVTDGGKRAVVSGSGAEIRKEIDDHASAGLEYFCASMLHPSASEIIADVRRFSADVVRSYA